MTEPVPGEIRTTPEDDSTDEAAPDENAVLEGARRRARREREERRAVASRARAIEDARREAKRKVAESATAPKPPRKGVVRGLKVVVWTVVLTVIAVLLGLVLYFTPVMSVRNLIVDGLMAVPRDEVVAAVAVPEGTPLLQVDTNKVANRVAGISRVASVRVQREYPSSLRVTVVERIPVAVKDEADGTHLFDRDGVDFATGPPAPGVPYLDVDNPGPNDSTTKAALTVLTSLRPEVAGQVGRVSATSVASISLTLADGRVVIWGTTDRSDEKAEKLAALLTRPGHTYDVSSPDLPTVK